MRALLLLSLRVADTNKQLLQRMDDGKPDHDVKRRLTCIREKL